MSGLKAQDPLIGYFRWLSGMLLVGKLWSGSSVWLLLGLAVCYNIVVHNSYVVMKEGSKVFLCVVSVCVCVFVWMLGGRGFDSVVSVSLAKMGNNHQLPLHLLQLGLELRAATPHPPCSPDPFKIPDSVAGVFSRPGLCSGHHERGLRSLQASGCPFMLLCLRNHVTMYLPHTVFISTLQFICTDVFGGNRRVQLTCVCVWEENTNLSVVFFFFKWFSVLKFSVVL